MDGRVKKVVREKLYGFIASDKADYFFHKEDFEGDWRSMCDAVEAGADVQVTFEPTRTDKGLRATDVSEK